MADDRIIEWAQALIAADARAFMEVRRRFLRAPGTKRLHELRKSARRLSCAFDDFRDVVPPRKRKCLKDLIELTGLARDSAVLRTTLRNALDSREKDAAKPMLHTLRERERDGLAKVKAALREVKFR